MNKTWKHFVSLLILLLTVATVHARPVRRYKTPEETVLAEEYKSFTMDRTGRTEDAIETELFGKPNYSSTMVISSSDGGVYFDYYFYDVDGENLCLGVVSFNALQNDAVVYVNTKRDCGSKCKVYLDKPEGKQVFYIWEPLQEIVNDNAMERITIKTDKKTYTFFVRTGIRELELTADGFPKLKSVKGLEKLPDLVNLTLVGFDY